MLNNIPLPDKATYIYIFTDLTSKTSINNFIEKNFNERVAYDFDHDSYYWSLKQTTVLLISSKCFLDLKFFSKDVQYFEKCAIEQN